MSEEELEEFYKKEAEKREDNFTKKVYPKTYEEEFDPKHYFELLDPKKLTNIRSNAWNVQIDYEMYDQDFKKKFQETVNQVNEL